MQLALSGVSFTYPSATEPIINNVTIAFPQGWTGLLGDNGCGKTTLARIACAQLEPDAGSVTQSLLCALCEQGGRMSPGELRKLMVAFPGALVLVSHDERFLTACTSARWEIERGVLSVR